MTAMIEPIPEEVPDDADTSEEPKNDPVIEVDDGEGEPAAGTEP